MQNLIEGLNDKQKEAVLATEGPCLVIAGAGSGKTKVLTHKIAYLISEKNVKPYNILAITFTNKAASEMKQRVEKIVGDVAQEMWMGTFHSICVRILRRFIDRIGFDTSFLIFDTSDQKTVVKECLKALNISGIINVMLGILIGIIAMIFCDVLVEKNFNQKTAEKNSKSNSLLKTGMIVSIGLAIHNFPEGLAIGSGFEASIKLGLSLAIAICLHDIPEGISMAVPMKNGGMKKSKVIFYVVLSGVTTGIGAFLGALVGGISQSIIAMCLAFAAGAMIYIVSGELTPEANSLYHGRMTAVGSMLGLLIGIFAMSI